MHGWYQQSIHLIQQFLEGLALGANPAPEIIDLDPVAHFVQALCDGQVFKSIQPDFDRVFSGLEDVHGCKSISE
jgi:hypothetical protein